MANRKTYESDALSLTRGFEVLRNYEHYKVLDEVKKTKRTVGFEKIKVDHGGYHPNKIYKWEEGI